MVEQKVFQLEEVTEEIIGLAVTTVEGWYDEGPIDWGDVWDRMDGRRLDDGTELDLGGDLTSPGLKAIKRAVLKRRAGQ